MEPGQVAKNLEVVRRKIERRCLKNGVDPAIITVVGITKTVSPKMASEAVRAGLKDIGENKVQEALAKIPLLEPRPIWHMVGHLQKNKARKAVELFDVIQSVDDIELAQMISEHAGKSGKKMTVFLQVNSSYEAQKSGFDPAEILDAVEHIRGLPNLNMTGLMTIGPLTSDIAAVKKSFSLTRNLFERMQEIVGAGFGRLSMGMSNDYELALDYGANVVRIGTAIFGARGMK
jgi:pyridoxal phosphate enzyme (YggS family)